MLSPTDASSLRGAILDWYAAERREFPWRGTSDPYAVLVSEVMLQQTQASRVAERFPRFLRRFPTVEALARATPAAVLAEWSGLGYNRRALALRAAAAAVATSGWPRDAAGLERLPGVGPYTARAVASLAFGVPVGVVDTNVRRWLIRRLRAADDRRALQALADSLAALGSDGDTASWTHASMEFGASVCRSRSPRCGACPVAAACPSRGAAHDVPVTRQSELHGSARSYRGAVLRQLATTPGHAVRATTARARLEREAASVGPPLDDGAWQRILEGLERDGLVHRSRGELRLGAATIEP